MVQRLVKIALGLVLVVIILGSYTRLTDAGLGCPDWPGCYGYLTVPHSEVKVGEAEMRFPERPVEHFKAWNEMIHRYAAGILGLLVLAIAIAAVARYRKLGAGRPLKLPLALLAMIIFQAALGMWTVTMNLQPVIVMGHLLGGFTTFSLLVLLHLRENPPKLAQEAALRGMRGLAAFALIVVVMQIASGGWVAANYAALACTNLPICEGAWGERLDFAGAFSLPEAENYEFGVHNYDQRMTMHIVHRFGAIVVMAVMLWLLSKLWLNATSAWFRRVALTLTVLLVVQVLLGITNVLASLPLAVAVAHNAVGALLMVTLVALNFGLYRLNKKEVSHG
ncbi:COX15/CtaA family protein [Aliidiomarina iranensis]|uniref:COX15/CtaA family protein n=1 Tax=Aliidiomarina iranensis TaxID=1434071 RepID=UPI0026CD8F67